MYYYFPRSFFEPFQKTLGKSLVHQPRIDRYHFRTFSYANIVSTMKRFSRKFQLLYVSIGKKSIRSYLRNFLYLWRRPFNFSLIKVSCTKDHKTVWNAQIAIKKLTSLFRFFFFFLFFFFWKKSNDKIATAAHFYSIFVWEWFSGKGQFRQFPYVINGAFNCHWPQM